MQVDRKAGENGQKVKQTLFFKLIFFFIEVWLIYKAVLVSGAAK